MLHPFIKRDPQNSDEEEHIENLFNALCSCLMSDETRRAFVDAEGVELMVLMLKARRFARAGALKALDFALTRSQAACEHFVETLGLKPSCAISMGRTKVVIQPFISTFSESVLSNRASCSICSMILERQWMSLIWSSGAAGKSL